MRGRRGGAMALLWLLLLPRLLRAEVEAGYDPERGAYVRTSDGRWELNPYAMVQLMSDTEVPQDAPASTSAMVRAARLIFHGHVFSPTVTYHVQVNFAGGKAVPDNVYLHYQPWRWLGLLVGQIEVPLNRQHITLEAYQQFVERSQVDRQFNLQRSVGLIVYVSSAKHALEWTSGLFRAPAADPAAGTLAPMLTTRFSWSPFGPIEFREGDLALSQRPRLQLALAGVYDPYPATPVPTPAEPGDVLQAVAELTLRFRGISISSEGHVRRRRGASPELSYGAFGQVGVLVLPPNLELVGRYGWLGGGMDSADVQRETTTGASYYFHGHRLKVQGNYSRIRMGASTTQHRILFQLEFFA